MESTRSEPTPRRSSTSGSRRSSITTTRSSPGLPSPPIIMGHSFGGAFAEVLLDRGLGAAGVAIDAAAVKGITKLPFAQLKSAFPGAQEPGQQSPRRGADRRGVPLRVRQHDERGGVPGGVRALRRARSRTRPVPGRVRQLQSARRHVRGLPQRGSSAAPADRGRGRPHRSRGGGQVSGQALPQIVRHHRSTRSSRAASHFIIGQDGWEEVADYALDWATEHARVSPPA